MRDAPENGGDGNSWRSGSEESFGPEKKQTAQGKPIGQGVRLGEGRPEQKLVERVKSEHPDQSAHQTPVFWGEGIPPSRKPARSRPGLSERWRRRELQGRSSVERGEGRGSKERPPEPLPPRSRKEPATGKPVRS